MKKIKQIHLFFFLLCSSALLAQNEVQIDGTIFSYKGDTLRVSTIQNNRYVDVLKAVVDKNGKYVMKGKIPAEDYYVFRAGNANINLILRNGSKIQIHGDGSNLQAFHNIVNSEESRLLNEFVDQLRYYNYQKDSANTYLRSHPEEEKEVNQAFGTIYTQFQINRNSFLASNQNSAALLPLLSAIDPETEFAVYEQVVQNLVAGFPQSPSVQSVKAQYDQYKAKVESMNFLASGKPAPDFTQPKPDGTPMKLSDLKGKVVLLDFWASWCGPCRRENPNVVQLYEKYKKDGFTVMSVSLDKDKDRWLEAIQKDRLTWENHVSDLSQWSNEAARLYKVSGIPFTVLIDREGNIIDTKLRGPELAQTLEQIFGH